MPPPANIEVLLSIFDPMKVGDESLDWTPPPTPLLPTPWPPVPEWLLMMLDAVNTGREPDRMRTPPPVVAAELFWMTHPLNVALDVNIAPPPPPFALAVFDSK